MVGNRSSTDTRCALWPPENDASGLVQKVTALWPKLLELASTLIRKSPRQCQRQARVWGGHAVSCAEACRSGFLPPRVGSLAAHQRSARGHTEPRAALMERMEVEPSACAAMAGGGALRRSNSAPMITGVSDGSTVFSSSSSARFRRSSVSVNPPSQLLPLAPFPLNPDRTEHKRHDENMELALRSSLQRLSASSLVPAPAVSHWSHSHTWSPSQDSGVTPNSSPSPTRRFRPTTNTVRWPPLAPLKRKGGVESDGPPKKLFVAGVSEPQQQSNFSLSVSEASDSPPLSAPPSFSSFSPHQH